MPLHTIIYIYIYMYLGHGILRGTLIQQPQQCTPLQLSHYCPLNSSLLSAHSCVPSTKVFNHERSLMALSHGTIPFHVAVICEWLRRLQRAWSLLLLCMPWQLVSSAAWLPPPRSTMLSTCELRKMREIGLRSWVGLRCVLCHTHVLPHPGPIKALNNLNSRFYHKISLYQRQG